jgi:hypothetical protein
MSVQPVEATAKTTKRPALWHSPAGYTQRQNALTGQPWVARCGKRVKRAKPGVAPRRAFELSPMEPCVVCVSLMGGAS